MSKKLPSKKFNRLSLPDEIGNVTVNDLLNHPDTDMVKKGNKVSIRRRSEHGVTTLEFTSYETGRSEFRSASVPHLERKKDYLDDILAMKRSGMRQKDIAFELGISEAYVSKILRKSK